MRAPELQSGHIVAGRYTVRSALAHSGATATYAAITVPNRDVALKLFSPALQSRPELLAALKRAELTISGLAEEVACRVLDSGIDAGTGAPFQVTDLVVHPSLAQLVELCPLSAEETVKALAGVARAVDAAHAHGLAHGLLKPENVFVGPAPHYAVKVSDFGVWAARAAFPSEEAWARALPWLAPEEALSGAAPSPAGDVFSVALLAFFALTGKSYWRAWQGGAPAREALEYEMRDAPAAASTRAAEDGTPFDPAFDAVFARGLARNPKARFPHVGDLVRALSRGAGGQPLEISAAPPPVRMPNLGRGLGGTMLLSPGAMGAPAMPHVPTLPHGLPVQPVPTPPVPTVLHQTLPLAGPPQAAAPAPAPTPSPPPAQIAAGPRPPPPRTPVAKVPAASVLLASDLRAATPAPPAPNPRMLPTMPAIRPSAPSLPVATPQTAPAAVSAAEPTAVLPRARRRTGLLVASLLFGLGIAGGAIVTVIIVTRSPGSTATAAGGVPPTASASGATPATGAAASAPVAEATKPAPSAPAQPPPSTAPTLASASASSSSPPADSSMGTVSVECRPACTWLRLDYKLVTNPSEPISVSPGAHTILAGKPSFQMQARKLDVKAGRSEKVVLLLVPDRPCPKFSSRCP